MMSWVFMLLFVIFIPVLMTVVQLDQERRSGIWADDMRKILDVVLEDSSCSAPMGEWDESFVDGLSE